MKIRRNRNPYIRLCSAKRPPMWHLCYWYYRFYNSSLRCAGRNDYANAEIFADMHLSIGKEIEQKSPAVFAAL